MKPIEETPYRFRIEQEGAMRVPGIVFASRALLSDEHADMALAQVASVATLPGTARASFAMPDVPASEFAGPPTAAAAVRGTGLSQHRVRRGVGQHLAFAAAVAIHRDGGGQVDRLGHGGIDVALHGGLHAQMRLRRDLGRGRERRPHRGRQLRAAPHSPRCAISAISSSR